MKRIQSQVRHDARTLALFFALFFTLAVALCSTPRVAASRQQSSSPTPQPTPARTGRSYETGDPARKPPPPAPQAPSPVTFTDIAARAGVNFRHAASTTSQKYLPESMGGGVALFDYDGDERLDIYFTNGASLADPMPPHAQPDKRDARYWNRLYRQKPDGTFEDVTERAGVKSSGYSMGAASADYDNDGFADLYVTAYGGATLYRNRGDGTFEDVTKRTNTFVSGWPTSAGWFDYDRDGRLDLFVARYMTWDFERGAVFCGSPAVRAYCHPDTFKGATNVLLRQKPDGSFEDVSAKAAITDPNGKALGVAFSDFDADGFADVFVANDSVRQQLYRNRGDGTFEEVAMMAGAGYDENGKTFAGMGVDAADYDNDGQTDIFITALSNETYPLYRNNGDLTFTYTTGTTGVGQITLLYSGWGTRFADFDNDGWKDIFVAQSHVLDTIERTTSYLKYRQTPLLMRNTSKGFVNVSATAGEAFNAPIAARGAAFGDIDNDGDTDAVVAQTDGSPLILRNNGTRHRWLGLRLVGSRSNRQALGARVTITDSTGARQVYEVTTASSYLSSNDPRLRIGLGTASAVRSLVLRWPDGRTQTLADLALDKYHTIVEK